MSAGTYIADSLRIAAGDLRDARTLAAQGSRNAAYLGQQAAEKIIRAVLTSEGQHAGNQHDLVAMVALVPDENPIKGSLTAVTPLRAYATSYRYPTDRRILPPPHATTLDALLAATETALTEATLRFDVDLPGSGPARNPTPIR